MLSLCCIVIYVSSTKNGMLFLCFAYLCLNLSEDGNLLTECECTFCWMVECFCSMSLFSLAASTTSWSNCKRQNNWLDKLKKTTWSHIPNSKTACTNIQGTFSEFFFWDMPIPVLGTFTLLELILKAKYECITFFLRLFLTKQSSQVRDLSFKFSVCAHVCAWPCFISLSNLESINGSGKQLVHRPHWDKTSLLP